MTGSKGMAAVMRPMKALAAQPTEMGRSNLATAYAVTGADLESGEYVGPAGPIGLLQPAGKG